MSLVGLMWVGACRPRANSEPPEPVSASASEPEPPAVEPWLEFADESGVDPDDAVPPSGGLCTTGPEDLDGFMDDDNCADPDNDGDGVRDVDDMCPNDPEDFDGFQDEDGCPDLDPQRSR
jgi:hypothetical protein